MPESSTLTPGIFLDIEIGKLVGDLPADFDAARDDHVTSIRCYSTDANAAIEAGLKCGVLNGRAIEFENGMAQIIEHQGNGEYAEETDPYDTVAIVICLLIKREIPARSDSSPLPKDGKI